MTQTIEVNLADILTKIDQRLDRIEQSNIQRFDRLEQSVNDLKVSVARLEEKTESLEEKIDSQGKIVEAKIDGLDKRIVNQEFINRSVLAALIVGIIGGFAKLFGFIDKV
jgi:lipid II:glycine glycyltransferase (peptidoglycan interpeptide bridge formation enzyme)